MTAALITVKSFGSNEYGRANPLVKNESRPLALASDTGDIANTVEVSQYNYSLAQPLNGLSLHALLKNQIRYPSTAYENQIQGEVKVKVTVEANGKVSGISVVETPDSKLSEAVVTKIRNIVFKPAMQNGYPVKQSLIVPVSFRLL